jgi:flagellin
MYDINTNMASLIAQNNLNNSQSALQTSLQRLSSGLRINSAKDDAAGYAISTQMTSQIDGANQAVRNSNDGINLSQTAEGALSTITDNLQTMRDLAVQASNGTYSATQRADIQAEVNQLSAQINTVASTTQFNGISLLNGSFQNVAIQTGANAGQSISVSLGNASTTGLSLGGGGTNVLGLTSGISATPNASSLGAQPATQTAGATISTTNTATGQVSTGYIPPVVNDGVSWVGGFQVGNTSALAAANAVNSISAADGGVTASALTVVDSGTITNTAGIQAGSFFLNGVDIGAVAPSTSASSQTTAIAAAINNVSSQTGVTATVDSSGTSYTLTAADGRNIDIANSLGGGAITGTTLTVADNGFVAGTTYGTVALSSNSAFTLADGTGASAANQIGIAAGTSTQSQSNASGGLNVSTQVGAQNAITTLDNALTTVNDMQAYLGALQNRFTSVVSNLNTTSQNLTASRASIEDTNFAAETANLTRAQILEQAGTAMLAQANSLPNGVMALLR